jgi:hypothetical protein
MSEDLYRFCLLEKTASGYTLIACEEVRGPATASVNVIEDVAREAIDQWFGPRPPSTADIELDVYQVPQWFIVSALYSQLLSHQNESEMMEWVLSSYKRKCGRFSMTSTGAHVTASLQATGWGE